MSPHRFAISILLLASVWLGFSTAASASISVEGALAHERIAARGESYRGVITIRNNAAVAAQVKVFQTDYSFAADGTNDYGSPGKMPRSNAPWLRLDQEQYTVPPKGRVNVLYEVRVPEAATLTGTYWSMVMVEPLSAREAAEPSVDKKGEIRVGLAQVLRFAVQVVTEVGEGGRRELELRAPTLVQEGNARTLRVDVGNAGERLLKPELLLELNDAGGGPARNLRAQKLRIYPGTSVRFRFDLTAVPAGRYRALVAADAGGDDLFGTEFDVILR